MIDNNIVSYLIEIMKLCKNNKLYTTVKTNVQTLILKINFNFGINFIIADRKQFPTSPTSINCFNLSFTMDEQTAATKVESTALI